MPDAVRLLRALARHLPDDFLVRHLPDHTPDACRQTLLATASSLAPKAATSTPAEPLQGPQKKGLTLCTDGASRGNPGDAAAGFVLYDTAGAEILAGGRFLGTSTNNVAEYHALILGLEHALDILPESLTIKLDSELVVKQIKGMYKVRHPDLMPLFTEAQKLLTRLPSWTIQHIPRKQNQRADSIANQALDNRWPQTVLLQQC